MAGTTKFPDQLDTFPEIGPETPQDAEGFEHDIVHNDLAAALAAVQAKVGVDESGDEASLDFRVAQLEAGGGGAGGKAPYITVDAAEAEVGDPTDIQPTIHNATSLQWRIEPGEVAPPGITIDPGHGGHVGDYTDAGMYEWVIRAVTLEGSIAYALCKAVVTSATKPVVNAFQPIGLNYNTPSAPITFEVAAGDLLIYVATWDYSYAPLSITGFTRVLETTDRVANNRFSVHYKIADGLETHLGHSRVYGQRCAGVLYVIKGGTYSGSTPPVEVFYLAGDTDGGEAALPHADTSAAAKYVAIAGMLTQSWQQSITPPSPDNAYDNLPVSSGAGSPRYALCTADMPLSRQLPPFLVSGLPRPCIGIVVAIAGPET